MPKKYLLNLASAISLTTTVKVAVMNVREVPPLRRERNCSVCPVQPENVLLLIGPGVSFALLRLLGVEARIAEAVKNRENFRRIAVRPSVKCHLQATNRQKTERTKQSAKSAQYHQRVLLALIA